MLGSKTDFGQWTEKVAKTRSGRQHIANARNIAFRPFNVDQNAFWTFCYCHDAY